jgi:hypothetical protein
MPSLGTVHLAIWLFISAVPLGAQTCTAPPAGLVAWWSGDGHFFDLVGTNNGTAVGGVGFAAGEVGESFRFNGVDGYISCPGAADLNSSGGVSVELWMWTTNYVAFAGLFDKMQGAGAIRSGFKLGMEGYGLHLLRADFGRGDGYPDYYLTPTNSVVVTDGNWHHAVATYDGTNAILYVDGLAGPAVPGTGYLTTNNHPVVIGQDDCCSGRFFNGFIDEVRLYRRALSAGEVSGIYAAGSFGVCRSAIPPRLVLTTEGADHRVSWFGIANVTYQPLASTNLSNAAAWEDFGASLLGTNGPASFTFPITTAPTRFFRLQTGN